MGRCNLLGNPVDFQRNHNKHPLETRAGLSKGMIMRLYDWMMKDNEQNYIRVVLVLLGGIAVVSSLCLGVVMLFD